jgi:hypothetical protein
MAQIPMECLRTRRSCGVLFVELINRSTRQQDTLRGIKFLENDLNDLLGTN